MLDNIIRSALINCKTNESIPKDSKKLWQKIYYNAIKLVHIIEIESILYIKYLFSKREIATLVDDGIAPIVSLTTFPNRINTLWIVLDSIFNQTILPAKIILVLSIKEFPNKMGDIPNSIKFFISKGLEIVFVEYNLLPHNKYYYALKTYTDRGIITLDDDLYYWPDTIERLVKLNLKFPECICANSLEKVFFINNSLNLIKDYDEEQKSFRNMALGVYGVYYPTSFRSDELFDTENIKKMSLKADDLWLKVHALLLGIEVICGSKYTTPLFVLGTQKVALRFTNVGENYNEYQWKNLYRYYNLSKFFSE